MLALAACASATGADRQADAPKASDIRALRWIAPTADKVLALTERPVACLRDEVGTGGDVSAIGAAQASPSERTAWGRILFESPALLGGAAARMGLSCSSCHLNGRDNPDFRIEGVSGDPGTADVTSSLLSKVRGNGAFDPAPIPDLAARDGKQIRDRTSPQFAAKVRGLIVEEFDGQEPTPSALGLVIAYLDRLSLDGCSDPRARAPVMAASETSDAALALEAAGRFARAGERADALLMARASRSILERLYERFVAPEQAGVRAGLVRASQAIAVWSQSVRTGQAVDPPSRLVEAASARALQEEKRSLYNPGVLRAALGAGSARTSD